MCVNPHYFGNIKLREKNKITRFFIVTTIQRNYKDFKAAVERLQRENYQFQVIVAGRFETINEKKIPDNIKKYFIFKHYLSYLDFFKLMETVDFVVINLYRHYQVDYIYNYGRATGSSQLCYGFLKPGLIQDFFSKTYGMNHDNSLIFNETIYDAMKDAIIMSNKKYRKMQYNLKKLADKLYDYSLNNVKIAIDTILQKYNYN